MDDTPERRLILVSNRLPYQLQEKKDKVTIKQSDGGLVTALKSYFEDETRGKAFSHKVWVGSADFPETRWQKFKKQSNGASYFHVEPIFIEPRTYNKYYNGFCNATLWPLFHYFTSYVIYDEDAFAKYVEVNKLFADKLLSILRPGDVLWIHDYHLFLLPELIREKLPDATIGFFLHIPFPSYEIFRLLHREWKQKLIGGLLGADLIGFHTHEYVQHFLKTVRMVMGHDHQFRGIALGNRTVKVDLFPLGIDYDLFHKAIHKPSTIKIREEIQRNFAGRKIIFSVDRLDYTKGVTHRLRGFEKFLDKYPEWREKVVFVLVVVPSRVIISKYNERRKMIEEHVGRINGKHSSLQWQPVIYRYSHLAFDELCALYQAADVGLITPLRDGMNLVAKEYIASRAGQKGVLILSELAGAASELGEALLVNPMDEVEMADAIDEALTMNPAEQRHKIAMMQKRLIDYDVRDWVNDFLQQLAHVKKEQRMQESKFITPTVASEIVGQFRNAKRRCLFVDYDGTLVPFARHPREAAPSKEVIELLRELSADENTIVTIISGRDSTVLGEWFCNLPVNLVAEHGASIKRIGSEWVHENPADQGWKQVIRPTLELFAQRSPGSFIEEKNHTLAWHYRNVERDLGFIRSRELLDSLFHLIRNASLQVIDGNKVIEVRVAGVDKGVAATKLLSEACSDFTLVIGDDKTDEDMFRALSDRAITIKVGHGHTQARYSIPDQSAVIPFFKQFLR
ncbi:MAG: bifunctional alpha,alpha-trehalose-phosphate synthase (UDP-forming)/trehalose-phosphatase [Cyclobacteriaceae bacterium]|jgi:trehalose 6-phosphate synthase/phosphatase|nr:bifunctional alpha,alpha-trehalose-phosphate synthase (UDP-forming)/trehalose-phosphatase [Cyclobacteriaceae bacterium]